MRPAAESAALLAARDLCWDTPDGRRVLNAVSFSAGARRTGVVGRNGTGKTTLLRLLAGELRPSAGSVERQGRVAWLRQARVLDDARSVAEMLGIAARLEALRRIEAGEVDAALFEAVGDDWDLHARAERVLASLGLAHLELGRPAGSLSGGEATRVLLAAALLEEPDFLLLDEPTNHLDAPSRAALYEAVSGWRRGLLVVSHDRALLRRVDQILELSPLGATLYGGAYDDYVAQRDAEAEAARRRFEHAELSLKRAQREAREVQERQQRRAARGKRERATGSQPKLVLNAQKERSEGTTARLAGRHEDKVEAAREAVQEARAQIDITGSLRLDLGATAVEPRRLVLELEEVRYGFEGAPPLLAGASLLLRGPERVALTGVNGAGKSTLIRLLLGELAPQSGSLRVGASAVACLDQRCAVLRPELGVLENLRACAPQLDEQHARWLLDQFLFPRAVVGKPAAVLSGGERVRAALACILAGERAPQLLILDEPTNDLDLDSLAQIVRALQAYQGALIVASHDADFRREVGVTRRWHLPGDGRVLEEIEDPGAVDA